MDTTRRDVEIFVGDYKAAVALERSGSISERSRYKETLYPAVTMLRVMSLINNDFGYMLSENHRDVVGDLIYAPYIHTLSASSRLYLEEILASTESGANKVKLRPLSLEYFNSIEVTLNSFEGGPSSRDARLIKSIMHAQIAKMSLANKLTVLGQYLSHPRLVCGDRGVIDKIVDPMSFRKSLYMQLPPSEQTWVPVMASNLIAVLGLRSGLAQQAVDLSIELLERRESITTTLAEPFLALLIKVGFDNRKYAATTTTRIINLALGAVYGKPDERTSALVDELRRKGFTLEGVQS